MKILLTGATGYIGKRLLISLAKEGHQVVCCVRDAKRFSPPYSLQSKFTVIEVDFLDKNYLQKIPKDIDAAYYLIHSMSSSKDYHLLEEISANNFKDAIQHTKCKHVIYLSGIVNESKLSKHLQSRKNVEDILSKANYNFTALRAGIIIGSGSASFEIIRDLVEKLPAMITPKWIQTKCQPIGISDVICFLVKTLFHPKTYNQSFDIGGTDILSYKEMLLGFAKARNLRRFIFTIPVMTPRLSSYWLYFVTSISYQLAIALVNSMKVEVVCKDNRLSSIFKISPLGYQACLEKAFHKIETNEIISSWSDAHISSNLNINITDFIHVPQHGCFQDRQVKTFANREVCINKIWQIGGKNGWYYGNSLWRLRGFVDKMFGGVGLRRGRTNHSTITAGDALDFWRVLYANKEEGRLLLLAEMKLPGEAWLEFKVVENQLVQTATFRPLGLLGRLYWYCVSIFHVFIFRGMANKLCE